MPTNSAENRLTREEKTFIADRYLLADWTPERISREKPGKYRSPASISAAAWRLGLSRGRQQGNGLPVDEVLEDIHDMMLLDYTSARMAEEITEQYGISISEDWVRRKAKTLSAQLFSAWKSRMYLRRSRNLADRK